MNKHAWWWVLAVAVIGIGLWYFLGNKAEAPASEEATAKENAEVEEDDTSVLWEFGIMSENQETGAPMREVSITYQGERQVVGTFPGSCSIVEDSSWPLLENELTGVICWWAGGGSEIAVFYEDGKRVLKVGALEEGTAETEGFRGDFETKLTLD